MSEYLRFWGKARPTTPDSLPFHPVAYHSLDVAAAAKTLLQAGVSKPPLPWEETYSHDSIVSLIALHDIGKFTRPFQVKRQDLWPTALGNPSAPPGPAHDTAGFGLLNGELAGELDQVFAGWAVYDRTPILSALCGHHGRPPQDVDRLDRSVACAASMDAARNFAHDVLSMLARSPLPAPAQDGSPGLGWWLAGFAVLADWIGSAERWFPYHAPNLSLDEYWREIALPRAAAAVAAAGVLPAQIRSKVALRDLVGADVPAGPVQALAQTLELGVDGPALVLIEDQTGSGKTEAALLLAHRLMAAGRADGLFVALPTMATANAMYDRLAGAYLCLFQEGAKPSLVLAHGRRADHAGFQASILQEAAAGGWEEGEPADEPSSAQCAAWIADDRRRTFLAGVGVGTIDQALLAVLPSRHAPLRLHGLHRRVLVVDEAHAYDSYMGEELLRLVEFQAGLGGSTVVLSATLPQATRRKLANAYAKGAGLRQPRPDNISYPLVTVLRRSGMDEMPCEGRPGLARRIEVERLDDAQEAVQRIAAATSAGQAVAWIRNAVDDAVEAHAGLAAQGVPATLFHARFAMGDRLDIESDVVTRFGRRGRNRNGVVVATQVIEQSLDIDFDLVVTDLAPMDLLVQRAGRLWRHLREGRPADRPRLLVLSPKPVEVPGGDWLGPELRRTGFVYADHGLLWRSAKVLFAAGAIEAPGDVRRLVETVYGGEAPAGLQRRAGAAEGKASAAKSLARQNLLNWGEGYQINAGAWANDVRTPTRLGEEGVTLRLGRWVDGALQPWCSADTPARSWSLSEVQVAPWLATGVPTEVGELAHAAALVRRDWGPWDREVPILALSPDGQGWTGSVLKDEQARPVRYGSLSGLRFG